VRPLMARVAMLFGALLIVLGLVGYLAPEMLGQVGPEGTSPTALIPAAIGAILFLCGLIVEFKPSARKHVMHLAAAIGLIGAVGGIMPLQRSKMDFSKASAVSGLLMILLCAIFVVLCIRSFVLARIARSEGLPEERRNV
jgi:peptidoglycan/LPS O-acetylase OafA/YrhL